MSGYIHSSVKGKMDRIYKPNPGKILVSDKFGNAIESDKTVANLQSELEEDSKIGTLSSLTTTNKSNLVAAINEVAASSGSVEEIFQTVYTTTLTSSQDNLVVTSENLNGTYVDVVVYVDIPGSAGAEEIEFLFDDGTAEGLFEISVGLSGTFDAHTSAAVMSIGGLEWVSWAVYDGGFEQPFQGSSSIIMPQVSEIGGGLYPTLEKRGVIGITVRTDTAFPVGTTITVYARREVTVNILDDLQ